MTTLHLPIVGNAGDGPQAALDTTMPVTARDVLWREEFILLLLSWPGQLRKKGDSPQSPDYTPQRHAKLMAGTQLYAMEMHYRDAKLHQQDWDMHIGLGGDTANERVRRTKYALPENYAEKDNSVEDVGAHWQGPEAMMRRFMQSEAHTIHLLGWHEKFREQTQLGVGVSGDFFCIWFVHPEE